MATQDLNLPSAVVVRLIKESLPDGISIAKEARISLNKAAAVFVLYITSAANAVAVKNNRKTIAGQDVIQAMEDMDFEQFIEPLQESLEIFKKSQRDKKDASAKRKSLRDEAEPHKLADGSGGDGLGAGNDSEDLGEDDD